MLVKMYILLVEVLIAVICTMSEVHGKKIFCYYSSFAQTRHGVGYFIPENINPFLCTHIIYAFVDISADGRDLRPFNRNDQGGNGMYARTQALKKVNPEVKVLLAVGGWQIGSKPFIPMIKDEQVRSVWIDNVVKYLRVHGFDGFDVDWEFPATRGSPPEDKYRFTLLMKGLYEAFAEESKETGREKLLLTLAAASGTFYIDQSYEPSKIIHYIDFMLLMAYNYHGQWEKKTGHHSGLYRHKDDPRSGEKSQLYQEWSINYWLDVGISKEKLIIGIPTYAMTFTLADASQHGVHAPVVGGGKMGDFTKETGILAYYEICMNLRDNGWKSEWIDDQLAPYAYGGDQWAGYEDKRSITLKANNILKRGLAGAFVWSVEMDDFSNTCGDGQYPLLSTITDILRDSLSKSAASPPDARVKSQVGSKILTHKSDAINKLSQKFGQLRDKSKVRPRYQKQEMTRPVWVVQVTEKSEQESKGEDEENMKERLEIISVTSPSPQTEVVNRLPASAVQKPPIITVQQQKERKVRWWNVASFKKAPIWRPTAADSISELEHSSDTETPGHLLGTKDSTEKLKVVPGVPQVANDWTKNGKTLIKPWPGVLSGSRGQKLHQKIHMLGSVGDVKMLMGDDKGTAGTKIIETSHVKLEVNDVIKTVGKSAITTEMNDILKNESEENNVINTQRNGVVKTEGNDVIKTERNGIYRTKGNGGHRPNLTDVIRTHISRVFPPARVDTSDTMEDTGDDQTEENETGMTSLESSEEDSSNYGKPKSVAEARTDVCREHGAGAFADPLTCDHFIICMSGNWLDIPPHVMACPVGTRFDASLKICNYASTVECTK